MSEVAGTSSDQGSQGGGAPPRGPGDQQHAGLKDLFQYPFMSALVERRTRRLARGTSLNAGTLSHESTNEPAPLSPLEEAIFIVTITGITGITTHDGPLIKPDGTNELGTPFLHITARTGSSADNCQATHFFMINDDGMFLLKHPTGQEALRLLNSLPREGNLQLHLRYLRTVPSPRGCLLYPRDVSSVLAPGDGVLRPVFRPRSVRETAGARGPLGWGGGSNRLIRGGHVPAMDFRQHSQIRRAPVPRCRNRGTGALILVSLPLTVCRPAGA